MPRRPPSTSAASPSRCRASWRNGSRCAAMRRPVAFRHRLSNLGRSRCRSSGTFTSHTRSSRTPGVALPRGRVASRAAALGTGSGGDRRAALACVRRRVGRDTTLAASPVPKQGRTEWLFARDLREEMVCGHAPLQGRRSRSRSTVRSSRRPWLWGVFEAGGPLRSPDRAVLATPGSLADNVTRGKPQYSTRGDARKRAWSRPSSSLSTSPGRGGTEGRLRPGSRGGPV